MALNITRSVKQMVAEANKHVEEISIADARELVGRDDVLFIDIRDIRELAKSGRISGARHVPRGMLEM
ncbi:MAG: rhodanese-like domain-containing protein, partial [Rhodospirillaceae bacterium]|nr:rhodanese-like domain-containing protein [Rhodospirillaceae bacterium]